MSQATSSADLIYLKSTTAAVYTAASQCHPSELWRHNCAIVQVMLHEVLLHVVILHVVILSIVSRPFYLKHSELTPETLCQQVACSHPMVLN